VKHLTLPAVALAFSSIALVARITRSAVREELSREHVQTAVSRGIPYRMVVRRHVMRNAAIPITTVVGITVASLFAASAVVERAFSLNGIGAYLIQAAGLVLLVAMVGAIVLTLRDREGVKRQSIARQVARTRAEGVETVSVKSREGVDV
jgi:ABC-type dipeptide/oligopeptide/nickel transport system permease component